MLIPLLIRIRHHHPPLGRVGQPQPGFDGFSVRRRQIAGPGRLHGEEGRELGFGELSAEEGFPDDEAATAFVCGPVGTAKAALAFDDGPAADGTVPAGRRV